MKYPQNKLLSNKYIIKKLTEFWEEDLPNGDITTNSIIDDKKYIIAKIITVEKLVFAGEQIVPHCFTDTCKINLNIKDGNTIKSDTLIGTIKGPANIILSRERVMLNLLQRLCGIATLSKKYSSIAKPYNIKILDTRKTTPGIRLFEKYAVSVGGSFNHRSDLSSGILIKDNHLISAGSVKKAINMIKKTNTNLPIELEVDTIEQIHQALAMGVDGFLLDNMSSNKIKEAVSIIRNSNNGKNIFIEASGGINLENISSYVKTGIDAISIGALTHQARSKDIRLEFSQI